MTEYDVLVYGPIFTDLIFTGLPSIPILGEELYAKDFTIAVGGSAIVASGLHRLGTRVGLISNIGNDPVSRILWKLLGDLGLDRSLIKKHPAALSQITVALSYPQDRAFVTYFEKPAVGIDLVTTLDAHPAKHLHFCSFLGALEQKDMIHIAHQTGMTVSMDPGWDENALSDPRLKKIIASLDVFLPSKTELLKIADEPNLNDAAHKILDWMPPKSCLIVKQGAQGATCFTQNFYNGLQVPAITVKPIDTTGAGDAFDAGFIHAFVKNEPLKTCLDYGIICGGLITRTPGGSEGFPTTKELEEWLKKLPS